jgi:hypothetical protein
MASKFICDLYLNKIVPDLVSILVDSRNYLLVLQLGSTAN